MRTDGPFQALETHGGQGRTFWASATGPQPGASGREAGYGDDRRPVSSPTMKTCGNELNTANKMTL